VLQYNKEIVDISIYIFLICCYKSKLMHIVCFYISIKPKSYCNGTTTTTTTAQWYSKLIMCQVSVDTVHALNIQQLCCAIKKRNIA
jgi:hypothetical protein